MKPQMQLKMYQLSKQGHTIEAETINTLNMDYAETISQRKPWVLCLLMFQQTKKPISVFGRKSQTALLMRSALSDIRGCYTNS